MAREKNERRRGDGEATLTRLMRAVIEARDRLARSRERLRAIELKLRGRKRDDFERQHSQALAEYIEAAGSAKEARTRLIKQLRERAA
jgi:uncharacterized coiled-coil protein SlyX